MRRKTAWPVALWSRPAASSSSCLPTYTPPFASRMITGKLLRVVLWICEKGTFGCLAGVSRHTRGRQQGNLLLACLSATARPARRCSLLETLHLPPSLHWLAGRFVHPGVLPGSRCPGVCPGGAAGGALGGKTRSSSSSTACCCNLPNAPPVNRCTATSSLPRTHGSSDPSRCG